MEREGSVKLRSRAGQDNRPSVRSWKGTRKKGEGEKAAKQGGHIADT